MIRLSEIYEAGNMPFQPQLSAGIAESAERLEDFLKRLDGRMYAMKSEKPRR